MELPQFVQAAEYSSEEWSLQIKNYSVKLDLHPVTLTKLTEVIASEKEIIAS